MKAITLQNFRAMQLAVKGACGIKAESLVLNGVDCSSDCDIKRY